jgi:hypothetical protein
MERILHTSRTVKALHRLANIEWAFFIFWAIYYSIILGLAYVLLVSL